MGNVVRYNEDGFVEDLPDLKTGRFSHACSWYINSQDKMVKKDIYDRVFHLIFRCILLLEECLDPHHVLTMLKFWLKETLPGEKLLLAFQLEL